MAIDRSGVHLWIVGGGIAGMAAAAFAIRDGQVPGASIHIIEELGLPGGSMDGAPSPAAAGAFVTRGGRMFEEKAYRCTWDLFSSIPSLEDPGTTVRQEMISFNERVRTRARARLIGADHRILDASGYGFSVRDRLEMSRLIATPESLLGSRRIDEVFGGHFFTTSFWKCWRTTFAFQKWHSAVEMRRYCLRFLHVFETLSSLSDVRRTVYNQYDSMIVPLQRWLVDQGVDVRFATRVADVDFAGDGAAGRRVTGLHLETAEGRQHLVLGDRDYALITIGSITADARYGGDDTVPELVRGRVDHGWSLWEQIAAKAPDFGRPITFCGNIDEHKWESFTLTMHGGTLLKRIAAYTGNEPGTGGLMTWAESGWHLSIVVPHQPHFPGMAAGTYTLWGYGSRSTTTVTTCRRRCRRRPAGRSLPNWSASSGSTTSSTRCSPRPTSPPPCSRTPRRCSPAGHRATGPRWYPTARATSPSSASSPSCPRTSCSPSSTPSTARCTPSTPCWASAARSRRSTTASSTRRRRSALPGH